MTMDLRSSTETRLTVPNGLHLIVDIVGGDRTALSSLDAMHNLLLKMAALAEMRPLTRPYAFHYDGEGIELEAGITGFLIIAESHISVHTYPAKELAFLDMFSCRPFDCDTVLSEIRRIIVPRDIKVSKLIR